MRRLEFDPAQHRYTLEGRGLRSNTQILKATGLVDGRFYTDAGRERGTRVHREVQREEEGDLVMDRLPDDIRPRVGAYLDFKKDTGFRAELVEFPIWSDTHGYATTGDLVGMLNGRRVIIDVKTGAVAKWNGLQLAGQDMALGERIHAGDAGINLEWVGGTPYPGDRFILQLKADGRYKLHPFRDPADHATFLGAVVLNHWAEAAGQSLRDFRGAGDGLYRLDAIKDAGARSGAWALNVWMQAHGLKMAA